MGMLTFAFEGKGEHPHRFHPFPKPCKKSFVFMLSFIHRARILGALKVPIHEFSSSYSHPLKTFIHIYFVMNGFLQWFTRCGKVGRKAWPRTFIPSTWATR